MLMLRAGIGMSLPDSRGAVAHTLQISVAREATVESAALVSLQMAARAGTCGSPPAWIHVPAVDRLVPVAAVLINT